MSSMRDALEREISSVRDTLKRDTSALDQKITSVEDSLRQSIELLRSSMTIRLGSMLIVGMSILFAALRLTGSD